MVKNTSYFSLFGVSSNVGLKRVVGVVVILIAILRVSECDNTCNIHTTIIRQVENTGFHRDLHSLVEIITSHPILNEDCSLALVETFPRGIYVNPDQLADLRRVNKLQACAADKVDIELPESSAPPSTVYVYSSLNRTENLFSAKVVLPIHLRYQNPTERGGYGSATLCTPSLLLRCEKDVPCVGPSVTAPCEACSQKQCNWLNVTFKTNSPKILLMVPVGNMGHHPLVIIVTLLVTCGGCFYILSAVLA